LQGRYARPDFPKTSEVWRKICEIGLFPESGFVRRHWRTPCSVHRLFQAIGGAERASCRPPRRLFALPCRRTGSSLGRKNYYRIFANPCSLSVAKHFPSAHFRHDDIEEDQVGILLLGQVDAFKPVSAVITSIAPFSVKGPLFSGSGPRRR